MARAGRYLSNHGKGPNGGLSTGEGEVRVRSLSSTRMAECAGWKKYQARVKIGLLMPLGFCSSHLMISPEFSCCHLCSILKDHLIRNLTPFAYLFGSGISKSL